MIEAANALRLPTAIATNGTRIAAAGRATGAGRPMFLLQISIDGPDAAMHNQARPGVGGADNFADIQAALAAVREARRARGSTLPLIASLTTISQEQFPAPGGHLRGLPGQGGPVCLLPVLVDRCGSAARPTRGTFAGASGLRRRGPGAGWGAGSRMTTPELNRQLEAVLERSRPWTAPVVTLIPSITGEDNLRTYYTDHQAYFGFDQCISIYQAVEVNSNGDLSPCRDYHDYVVGNIKEATITELWNSPAYQVPAEPRHRGVDARLLPLLRSDGVLRWL